MNNLLNYSNDMKWIKESYFEKFFPQEMNIHLFLGFFGVHVVMNTTDSYTHAFYGKLGFVENTHEAIKGKIVMGRTF